MPFLSTTLRACTTQRPLFTESLWQGSSTAHVQRQSIPTSSRSLAVGTVNSVDPSTDLYHCISSASSWSPLNDFRPHCNLARVTRLSKSATQVTDPIHYFDN